MSAQTPLAFPACLSLLLLLPLAAGLAGCLGTEDPGQPPDEEGGPSDATEAVVDLGDVPAEAEWILLRVTLSEPGSLTGSVTFDFPLSQGATQQSDGPDRPDRACFFTQVANEGGPSTIRPPQAGGGARIHGLGTSHTVDDPGGAFAKGSILLGTRGLDAGTSVPVILGLDDVASWRAVGAKLEISLSASAPFSWEIDDTGTIDCIGDWEDSSSGDYVEGSQGTIHASDVRFSGEFTDPGFVWLAYQADRAYDLRLQIVAEVVWEDAWEGAPGVDEAAANEPYLKGLPEGAWTLDVARFEAAGSGVLVGQAFSPPGWVHPWLPGKHAQVG